MRAALITLVTSVFGFAMCHVAEASKEKVLYSFCSQRNCADGDAPRASLTYVNGALYGTTVLGGNDSCDSGCGTLFKLNPETGAEAVLYAFPVSDTDGYHPSGNLTNIDGVLYGTTLDGGAYGIEYDGGMSCCRFSGHRVKVEPRNGGGSWDEGSTRESTSLKRSA